MVTLVYVDRTRQTVTEEMAWELCSHDTTGRIVDAQTEDKKLQAKLRWCMDAVTEDKL